MIFHGWNIKRTAVLLGHAFVVWLICGVAIGIGRMVATLGVTLWIHAFVAPLAAAAVSFGYYRRFHYTTPLQTAVAFSAVALLLDACLVAPVFEKSYAMFASLWGTWIPFALIFLATYVTGKAAAATPNAG